LPKIQDNSV